MGNDTDELEDITLSKRSPSSKVTDYMIMFI